MSVRPSTATLSEKFQISVPKSVRERQNWKSGQKLAFVEHKGQVILVPVPSIEDLRGSMAGANPEGYRDRQDRY